ncbi:MAG: class I SAM-dependent methyltransferase [Myxococcales bacterium]|jgi:ubiquinone/menaquinone biosynthesis C-methylase UbiE
MDRLRRTRKSYEQIAGAFLQSAADRSRVRPAIARFVDQLPAPGPVLDLGCGPGWDSAELHARGADAIALDLSEAMLRVAVERYPGPRVQADMRRLPFAAATFAGVWSNASLLHLSREDFSEALREARRVLLPSGLMRLTLKTGQPDGFDAKYGADSPRWFTYWDDASLDARIERAGFRTLQGETKEAPSSTWLIRLLRAPGSR